MENSQPFQQQAKQTADAVSENEALSREIAAIAEGDRQAFRRLYAHTSGKLFAICMKVTRNHAVAEDVLQEVYLKIWDRSESFDPERNRPLAWMGAIARNSAIDRYRACVRHPHVGDEQLKFQESEAVAADERIIDMEREEQVWSEVEKLDPESEKELKSIYLLGLTYPEAAERLDLPVATFKSRVRRTVLRISRKLNSEVGQ